MIIRTKDEPTWEVRQGDVLKRLREMPDESVHCVVTSPPYWGLRDYGVPDQLGLEATPDEYVAKIVEVFREVRRVMRSDATLWLNLGDSYTSGGRDGHGTRIGYKQQTNRGMNGTADPVRAPQPPGLKPKDLVGIPWRVAFALQADGWWLRSDIIWAKPNPMPESVTDRPTKAHEYVFLLTKSARYFYDSDAIAEEAIKGPSGSQFNTGKTAEHQLGRTSDKPRKQDGHGRRHEVFNGRYDFGNPAATRNKRTVWTITTKPYAEAHFATFPPELPEICIKAGTSEKGCCAECGAPWERVVEPTERYAKYLGKGFTDHKADLEKGMMQNRGINRQNRMRDEAGITSKEIVTTGWRPTCDHVPSEPVPCTVLDPFAGSGTTLMVALRLGRDAIGIELNPEYVKLAENRIDDDCPLFNRRAARP